MEQAYPGIFGDKVVAGHSSTRSADSPRQQMGLGDPYLQTLAFGGIISGGPPARQRFCQFIKTPLRTFQLRQWLVRR